MNFNGKSLGYAMITPAQIASAVNAYLLENPDAISDDVVANAVEAYLANNSITAAGAFFVTATVTNSAETDYGNDYTCTADKTMAEIIEAYNAGQCVYLRYPTADNNHLLLPMTMCQSNAIGFCLYAGGESIGIYGNAMWEALIEDDESFYVTKKNTAFVVNSLIDAKLGVIENGTY